MKYVIPNVRNKVVGAQDHISVYLVEISNMITNVYQIVIIYLGKFNVLTVMFEFLITILIFIGFMRLVTKLAQHVIQNVMVAVMGLVLNTVQNAVIFVMVFTVCLNVQ